MSTGSAKSGKKILRKTFTYFIPAPSHRKSGYREREFDKIMQGILTAGFEIENLKTGAISGEHAGFFVMVVLKTNSKKIFEMDLKQDLHENFKLSHASSSPDITFDEEEDA